MQHLHRTMSRLDGVARMTTLQRAGHSRHHLRRAIDDGSLIRIRRNWVALPGADRELVTAARAGAVLSCVTQARRLGLWVLDENMPHLAVLPHAAVPKVRAVVHWSEPLVPRHPDDLVDPVENVLALVAACQPFESALAMWESALRKRLVPKDVLGRLPFTGAARAVLAAADPFADSGLETIFLERLRWLDVRIVAQAWIEGHRVDFLIGERLVVQIDGGHHVGAQRAEDNAHDTALMLRGYHVIRVGYHEVIDDWAGVQHRIMQALAQGLHMRRS